MARRGSSPDWDDARDMSGSRSSRSGPGDSDRRGRSRLSNSQVGAALREAQQLQQDGELDEAIQVCEELLDSGVDRSDVNYFLGWLYQEADRWAEAAARFKLLLNDPDYALSCYYALGQCARAQGELEAAARYFDEAVDRVNLDALTHEESDQLIQLCQEAAEAHREMSDPEGAETVYTALLGFLRSQGWQDQVHEVEQLMRETLGTEPPPVRRRRSADASRPMGSNIPQRSKAAPVEPAPEPEPVLVPEPALEPEPPFAASAAGVPPEPQSAFDPAASAAQSAQPAAASAPPQPAWDPNVPPAALPSASAQFPAPPPGMPGQPFAASPLPPGFGEVMGGAPPPFAPAGSSPLSGAGNYYSGQMPPMAQGDQLVQLIHTLGSGAIAGARNALGSLPEPQRSRVAQAVAEISNYVAHGLLTAAIEECLRVMEIAPQYLEVHQMLAEIYVRQGKIEQAIAKYAILVETYMMAGRVDDAIATYRRILQLEPNNLNYRVKLIDLLNRQGRMEEVLAERMSAAESYLRLGYADRAIQEYEQALLANPGNTPLRLQYAEALLKAGRIAQAAGEYQRVLQMHPDNLIALANWQITLALGIGISSMGSVPGAVSGRAMALDVLGRLLRGLRAAKLFGYDDVVKAYTQVLELAPGNPDVRYALGLVHLAGGRYQEAAPVFQQVATAPGLETLAHLAAGKAYLSAGDPASAAAAVQELNEAASAVRRVPPDPAVWAAHPRFDGEEQLPPESEVSMLLARAYQISGQAMPMASTPGLAVPPQRVHNDEVFQALAEIRARQTDPTAVLQEFGQLARQYRTAQQVENALAVLTEMERLAPDDPAVRSELAEIQLSRGILDEAISHFRQLADSHVRRGMLRESAQVYERMSEISWGMENHTNALEYLRQAIQYAPENMSLRQQFVQYCLEIGRKSEAADQQVVIARFYFASRQTKEAVAALQQLIGMDPHNYEAYDLLGQTYYSVGEYDQAARVYRNLAKVDPSSQMARVRLQELQAVRAQMR